jgi:hypothetical protein
MTSYASGSRARDRDLYQRLEEAQTADLSAKIRLNLWMTLRILTNTIAEYRQATYADAATDILGRVCI